MSRLSPSGDAFRPLDEAVVPMTIIQSPAARATADPAMGKTVAEILGEIAWLMTQDPTARALPISEIERVVMPAILLQRFQIEYAIPHPGAALLPVRVRVWGEAGPDAPTLVAALPSARPT